MRALRVVPLRLECERHAHERMGKVGKQGRTVHPEVRAARTGEIEVVKERRNWATSTCARTVLLKRRCSAWARRTHPPTRPRPMSRSSHGWRLLLCELGAASWQCTRLWTAAERSLKSLPGSTWPAIGASGPARTAPGRRRTRWLEGQRAPHLVPYRSAKRFQRTTALSHFAAPGFCAAHSQPSRNVGPSN